MRKNVHNTSGIQSAYHRCFQELWKKWHSYGRIFWEKAKNPSIRDGRRMSPLQKKYGYQLIIKEYGKNPGQAKKLVRNVGQAQSGTILQSGLVQLESVN